MCEWIHFYVENKTRRAVLYASCEERQGILRRTFSSAGTGLSFSASSHERSGQHIAREMFRMYRLAVVSQDSGVKGHSVARVCVCVYACVRVCVCTCECVCVCVSVCEHVNTYDTALLHAFA